MTGNKKDNSLLIVGGGITGLSIAYYAAKAGKRVTIVEATPTIGGLLNTFELGGNRLEQYYHHFFTHDLELMELIKELGLEKRLFFRKTSMGIYRDGKIFNFNSMTDLLKFKPISFLDKIRFGMTGLFLGKVAKWRKHENISAISWFTKWSGITTTQALWKPLLKVKFGLYADKVPLAWMIGRLRQRMNSRKRGNEKTGISGGQLANFARRNHRKPQEIQSRNHH